MNKKLTILIALAIMILPTTARGDNLGELIHTRSKLNKLKIIEREKRNRECDCEACEKHRQIARSKHYVSSDSDIESRRRQRYIDKYGIEEVKRREEIALKIQDKATDYFRIFLFILGVFVAVYIYKDIRKDSKK